MILFSDFGTANLETTFYQTLKQYRLVSLMNPMVTSYYLQILASPTASLTMPTGPTIIPNYPDFYSYLTTITEADIQ